MRAPTRPARTTTASALLAAAGLLGPPAPAGAQELEPRAYANLPIGLNFLAVGYAHSTGGLATDPSIPIEDAHLRIDTGLFAYVRSIDFWGRSGKFDVIVPYSHLAGTALVAGQAAERNINGFSDPRLRLSVNFYGAPSLTVREFRSYDPDWVAGASVQVSVPLGQYDPSRAVNLGTNRWSIKPDIGLSKSFGDFTADITAGVAFFTTNHDFFGGQKVEKDPLYSIQTNVSYNFPGGAWTSLGATFYSGGRTTANGVRKDDAIGNSRIGLTVSVPIDRSFSIKFNASTGISTRTGTDFDTLGVVGQYRWGAGL